MTDARLLLLAAALAACSPKQSSETAPPSSAPAPSAPAAPPSAGDPDVERTFDFVVRTLRRVGEDRTAAAAFSGQIETGGDPITYIASNMPDEATFSNISWVRPSKPRSVVVRAEPGGYAVEAYLDDLGAPVRSVIVPVPPARRE